MSVDLKDASVIYHRGAVVVQALKKTDLKVETGDYVAIVGPNGAGKSTLINAIAGSVDLASGRVLIEGGDVTGLADHQRAAMVSRVHQDPTHGTCEGLTVLENAAIAMRKGQRRSPLRRAYTSTDIDRFTALVRHYGRSLEDRLQQDVAQLSGGQRQLLSVIMAISGRHSVLLFDEHTSALDPEIGELIMEQTDEIIRAETLTTVMVTHNLRLAVRYGNRLLIMAGGRIVADISGEEKAELTEDQLLARFRELATADVTDRLVGG